jgi:hypothetical protein
MRDVISTLLPIIAAGIVGWIVGILSTLALVARAMRALIDGPKHT